MNIYVKYGAIREIYPLRSEMDSDLSDWRLIQVPISEHKYNSPFQYVIEVTIGSGFNNSLIAIDDMDVKESCSPIGSCDFEEDFCTYTNNKLADFWARGMGQISEYGPKEDHTLGDEYGVYAYFNNGNKH